MKKILLISGILSVILTACSHTSAVPFPEPPAMPVDWGQYDLKHLNGSQCPNLQGKYSFPKTKIVVEGSIENEENGKFADYFGLFSWSLAEKQAGSDSKSESEGFLHLDQPSEQTMVIELLLSGDRNSHNYRFEASESDFICEDDVLKFPTRHSFGGIEGSSLNGQIRVGIRKAEDGALIVMRTYGIYRSRNASDTGNFKHEFYRFIPSKLQ